MPELQVANEWSDEETDFLTPEQRLNAVCEIMATIALRAYRNELNDNHEQEQSL